MVGLCAGVAVDGELARVCSTRRHPAARRRWLARYCIRDSGDYLDGRRITAAPRCVPRGCRHCCDRSRQRARAADAGGGTPMIRLKGMIDRVPRTAFYVAAALVQIVLIAIMVIDRVRVLRTGVEVKLHTHAVDPRDFLRGDYVTLGYDMSTLFFLMIRRPP